MNSICINIGSWIMTPYQCKMLTLREPASAAAESLQSCPTLCDPIDGSPPGSPVPGILQVRTLGWIAISFSSAWKWKVKVKSLSCIRLPATPWTAAYQASPSIGFSRQEYWSGVPSPSPISGAWLSYSETQQISEQLQNSTHTYLVNLLFISTYPFFLQR